MDQISSASEDQARGIEQTNIAVGQVDKLTQQTAAHAEESASASEQMYAQVEKLKRFVDDMVGLVGARRKTKVEENADGTAFDEGPAVRWQEHAGRIP